MRIVVKHWRKLGIAVLVYLDYFLVAANAKDILLQHRMIIEKDLETLGLVREKEKGSWEPTQIIQHLGLVIDTREGMIFIPEDKLNNLENQLKILIQENQSSARTLASVAGKVISLSKAFAPARIYTRELYVLI